MSLASGFAGRKQADGTTGLQVTVVTPTSCGAFDDASLPFRVVRRPSPAQLLNLVRAADLVHVSGPAFLPMLFGLLLGKPIVVEHSTYQAICPNGLLLDERTKTVCPGHFGEGRYGECWRCNSASVGRRKSMAMLLLSFPRRWMSGRVARNVVPTAHEGKRVALPRTVTIYHGVPLPPALPPPEAQILQSPVSFAYVGRLVSEKGLHLLVDSARRLLEAKCNFRLKFIGDGPERARLEREVDTSGLRTRVVFTGYLRGEELEKVLGDVGVVVMPSIWEETAGLAAMEHMMRGRMVIAADIGGLGELVDGTSLKFPAGDIDALACCMKRVIDDPGLARALGQKARQRAEQLFVMERMVAEHFELYRSLLGG